MITLSLHGAYLSFRVLLLLDRGLLEFAVQVQRIQKLLIGCQ